MVRPAYDLCAENSAGARGRSLVRIFGTEGEFDSLPGDRKRELAEGRELNRGRSDSVRYD
jgi:hypothetical protein